MLSLNYKINNKGAKKMAKYDLKLRPIHYASVSGGKDSLYMLNLILNNPDKYPLDMVAHFELEIDWDWTKAVIDFMEQRCKQAGIKFVRIKPRKTWDELYKENGFPRKLGWGRWCNLKYKLDAKEQLHEWIKSQNCRPIAYIGLCADETKRFKYEIGSNWNEQDVCYPLAEEGITEDVILRWAKTQPLFNNWYKYFRRQGCAICPMISMKEQAYMYKYYPKLYERFISLIDESDKRFGGEFFGEPIEKHRHRVETKWKNILDSEEQFSQMDIYDFMNVI
jgi:3'-phosphoadenosine 5'-phosphosulfate sulfotransferase (PAPS reductase)/FAD synthetase